jgi:glycosyltransferase involved in cell wall biosynthesis
MNSKICLVIPVFNENQSIANSIPELAPNSSEYKLLFIDDGSTDKTLDTLLRLQDSYGYEVIAHQNNAGYGAACRTGAKWAIDNSYEWVIFADSDLTNPPSEIKALAVSLEKTEIQVYKANRVSPKINFGKNGKKRQILSAAAKLVSVMLIGKSIKDPTNGFRAVHTSLYKEMNLRSSSFSLIMEEVCEYIRLGAKISNFQSYLGQRSKDQRISSFSYDLKTFNEYLTWCFKCLNQRFIRFVKGFIN